MSMLVMLVMVVHHKTTSDLMKCHSADKIWHFFHTHPKCRTEIGCFPWERVRTQRQTPLEKVSGAETPKQQSERLSHKQIHCLDSVTAPNKEMITTIPTEVQQQTSRNNSSLSGPTNYTTYIISYSNLEAQCTRFFWQFMWSYCSAENWGKLWEAWEPL